MNHWTLKCTMKNICLLTWCKFCRAPLSELALGCQTHPCSWKPTQNWWICFREEEISRAQRHYWRCPAMGTRIVMGNYFLTAVPTGTADLLVSVLISREVNLILRCWHLSQPHCPPRLGEPSRVEPFFYEAFGGSARIYSWPVRLLAPKSENYILKMSYYTFGKINIINNLWTCLLANYLYKKHYYHQGF